MHLKYSIPYFEANMVLMFSKDNFFDKIDIDYRLKGWGSPAFASKGFLERGSTRQQGSPPQGSIPEIRKAPLTSTKSVLLKFPASIRAV